MALDYIDEYPGQVVDGDPNYPYGAAQNVSVEGDGTGTPLEKALVNDHFGFLQALLLGGGITPSNVPDTALDSQYLKAIYRILKWAKGWGAVGDGATDDTAALQAALNAVSALGFGRQVLNLWPGAAYRHTGLSVPPNVDIVFHGASLTNTHATNHGLTYASSTTPNFFKQELRNGILSSTGGTGSAVKVTAPTSYLLLDKIWFGASAAKNLDVTSSNVGRIACVECTFSPSATVQVDFAAAGGALKLERCRSFAPATYSTSMVRISGASLVFIDKHQFDLRDHSSGTMACIEVTNAGAVVHVTDNDYFNDTDVAPRTALKWTAAAKIIERGSTFRGNGITPYNGGGISLAETSSLQLLDQGSSGPFPDDNYTIPPGYRHFTVTCSHASALALDFPQGLCPGQILSLIVNLTAGAVFSPTIDPGVDVTYQTLVLGGGGNPLFASFVWTDPLGGTAWRWVQLTPWGAATHTN